MQTDWIQVKDQWYHLASSGKLTCGYPNGGETVTLTQSEPATCEGEGYEEYTCSVCGATHQVILPKTEHNYKLTNETSTEKTYTCKNCNATYTEKKEIIKEDIKEEPVEQEYTVNLKNGETTTVVGYFDREMADEIFTQLNEYRTSKGLPTFKTR